MSFPCRPGTPNVKEPVEIVSARDFDFISGDGAFEPVDFEALLRSKAHQLSPYCLNDKK